MFEGWGMHSRISSEGNNGHSCDRVLCEGVKAFVVFDDDALMDVGWYFRCWVAWDYGDV
jgi:hypothetical protein